MEHGSTFTTYCNRDCVKKTVVINIQRLIVWIVKALQGTAIPGGRGYDAGKKINGRKRHILVDGGYNGRLVEWVTEHFKFCLTVVLRPKETRKFVLLPRRWVVERTFEWLNHSRRLSKSYERLPRTDESLIYIAMTRIMLERIA